MTKREYRYLKAKPIPKKIGIASWNLGYLSMSQPDSIPNMAIMLPGGPLTHHDGTPVLIDPKFQHPNNNLVEQLREPYRQYGEAMNRLADIIHDAKPNQPTCQD